MWNVHFPRNFIVLSSRLLYWFVLVVTVVSFRSFRFGRFGCFVAVVLVVLVVSLVSFRSFRFAVSDFSTSQWNDRKLSKNSYFTWVGLFLFVVSCLQCYQCSREDNNDAEEYCALSSSSVLGNNTKINCSAGEDHCLIMRRLTKEKSVDLFTRKCADKSECHNSCTDPDERGVKICDQCCEEDLCNKGMGPPLPLSRTSRIQMMTGLSLAALLLLWFF